MTAGPVCSAGEDDATLHGVLSSRRHQFGMTQKSILLIDDDQTILQSLKVMLEQAGYEVLTATDGHQGMDMALTKSPDLIVLDLLLPGLDGYELCARLKEDARYADIPIIMLTGVFVTAEDMQRGLQLGAERFLIKADACVAKPPVSEKLLQNIRVLLGEATSAPPSRNNLVLVVDGDEANRKLLQQTLSDKGYPVITAVDGEEGLARFQSSTPSVVLLDMQMADQNGLEVLEQIRGQAADVAVIMMMASGTDEVVLQAIEGGADDFVIKPAEPWRILLAVEGNLEKARLRRLSRQLTMRLRDSSTRLMQKHRALQSQNTAVQEAYLRLQDADRMRRNMVSMIVHDLKSPLNVMFISIDLLATDFGDKLSEQQREILRNANMASQQMLHLITNLLEVQRLEDGKVPMNLAPLDLALTLKLTVRQSQPLAVQKDISLELSVPDVLPHVLADVDLTSRVVANLLGNAIKFTPLGGQITVTAESKEGEVVVSVADNGPGVPADQQKRIFEKFAQVDQGPLREKASVGLGLAFCKLAVEAQGGRIWVESEFGEGSCFKFALPVWKSGSGAGE